jgi:hypothetical protein
MLSRVQMFAFAAAALVVAAAPAAQATSALGAEVTAVAGSPKTAVVEYVQTNGIWPPPGEPTVVDAPETYAGGYVARLDLLGSGVIRIALKAAAGGGSVLLRPHDDLRTWDCQSADIADIGQQIDGCQWTGPAIGADVLAAVNRVKTALAEYYFMYGTMPPAGDPEVAAAPASYAGTWVERLDLLDGGLVRITLKPEADAGTVDFHAVASATNFSWTCTSATVSDIEAILPGCTWSGP